MIGCGIATMVSALGLGFIGPRLPIVMGVFYIFIGPIVAISKDVSLAAAMTALMIGGLVQFAWSPLIGKMQRFFPPIVTGTTILLIGTGPDEDRHQRRHRPNTPAFGKPLTLGLAALMIVLIIVISRFARGFVRALSLFITMVIGYLVSAALGLLNFHSGGRCELGLAYRSPFPYGGLAWPGLIGIDHGDRMLLRHRGRDHRTHARRVPHHAACRRGLAHPRRGVERRPRIGRSRPCSAGWRSPRIRRTSA